MPHHTVQITFKLSCEYGTEKELQALSDLADSLSEAIDEAGVGEFEGDDYEENTCRFSMFGDDADELYAAIEKKLLKSKLSKGATVCKRYGDTDDEDAEVVKVTL